MTTASTSFATELQAVVSRWCDAHTLDIPVDDTPVDKSRWHALVDLGVPLLLVPEGDGGLGLGLSDAASVCEILGHRLEPGPWAWAIASATIAEAAASGGIVTGIDGGASLPAVVEHLPGADYVLVVDDDHVASVAASDLSWEVLTAVDPFTPVALVRDLPGGVQVGLGPDVAMLRRDGACLTAATAVGVARRAVEAAVEYSRERTQFGRPVGGFQSIKHLLADAAAWVEVASAAVSEAGSAIDDGSAGAMRSVASAKLLADAAARRATRTCVQVHGGIGYTWEAQPHLLLKRASVLAVSFGHSAYHASMLMQSLGGR